MGFREGWVTGLASSEPHPECSVQPGDELVAAGHHDVPLTAHVSCSAWTRARAATTSLPEHVVLLVRLHDVLLLHALEGEGGGGVSLALEIRDFTIMENAPTRAFSLLKECTSAFALKIDQDTMLNG